MKTRMLAPFFLITFVWGWSLIAIVLAFPDAVEHLFGELSSSNPVFILAVYSPAIATFILVLWTGGLQALKRFLSRFLLWRAHWGWYLFLVIGIPLLFLCSNALDGTLFSKPFPFSSVAAAVSAVAFMMVLGPMEEFGWRGVAQPLLQRSLAPFWAAIVLGIVWAIWHLPAFFLSGVPQGSLSFLPFFIAAVAISLIITPLFNSSGGSILLPAVMHWQLNTPLIPNVEPYNTVVFAVAAAVIIWINRKTMFDKSIGVTEVIPGEASGS